ncbi:MAG: HD domain-containing phosphohydrolase [Syntrophomonas sp.]
MTSKQQVMIGLVSTALIASLAISDFLPGWVISIILLLVGVGFTYYLALNQKRIEQIEDLRLLLETSKRIYNENSSEKIITEITRKVRYLTGAEWAWACLLGSDQEGELLCKSAEIEGLELDTAILSAVNNWIIKYPQPQIVDYASADLDLQPVFADGKIKSLLAVPLKNSDRVIGVLCLGNKKGKEVFSRHDQQMAEILGQYASRRLINIADRQDLQEMFTTTLKSIASAVEAREEGFSGHAERVAAISVLTGKKLGLPENEIQTLEYSAILHDIGKLVIPVDHKNDLVEEDGGFAEQHPVQGADIFPNSDFFTPIKEAILYHHERYNGTGYPEGREKNDIPFLARIIAVADFYDALTRLCSEEERLNHYQAFEVIKKATGTLFDPLVLVALQEVEEEIKKVYEANL